MLSRADSIGVFQVESRAQMSMLPRLKPDKFYDLVIEVAIVRPGPIQGDMVHPYLRRRSGKEPVEYPSEALRQVLGKTLGVPLFQEQAMKIAIVGAGFPPDEADRLRRAMATFKRNGEIHLFRDKFIAGMVANGYGRDFATRCFDQIEGFGTYGFPESHAASFALLVYVSAWIKCFHPDVFACALLNSQPMGFYAPAQIVRDARDHGVEVRPADVNHSLWDCTLEPLAGPGRAENPSPPFRGEREGPIAQRWEGEVGLDMTVGVSPAWPAAGGPSGTPHLTPALSAPGGGEGVARRRFGAVTPRVQASSVSTIRRCSSLISGSPANQAASAPDAASAAKIAATVRTWALSRGGPNSARTGHQDGHTSANTIRASSESDNPVSNGQIRARTAQRGSSRNARTTGIPVSDWLPTEPV